VARLGGDEFVVMAEGLSPASDTAASQARALGEKIVAALNLPYQLANREYHITPSIGIALYSGNTETTDEVLKHADLAMYQAKAAGRNTLRFFNPGMQAVVNARVALEADIRLGLTGQQFALHYQPQINRAGQTAGAEALLRWKHPVRGMISPAEFIPVAEETGLILPLGDWVLKTACAQLVAWAADARLAHLSLAVNVSARQFRQQDFTDRVLALIKGMGVDARRLKLELTESLLVNDVEDTIAKMTLLKTHGVGFSLDDFGTGYSSLSYLKRLPLDQLKIDQSFVRDLLTDPNDAAIARTVIALGHSLGLAVIAEGVETEPQRAFLAMQGCDAYQGYLFSRPLAAAPFGDWLHSHADAAAPGTAFPIA
jgi:predicted signal transduction protein with EAL and GGDEF domain